MINDVLIRINTEQFFEGQDNDSIELISAGVFEEKATEYVMEYVESNPENMMKTKTNISVVKDGSLITILREGEFENEMVFERGKKHLVHYDTEYGYLTVGFITRSIDVNMDKCGGEILISYIVEMNNTMTSRNYLKISVEQRK